MTNKDAGEFLKAMAKRLAMFGEEPFGGAFVALPPEGDAVDVIVGSTAPNVALFWATVKGKIEIAESEIDAQNQPQYGRRR
jgi:hypothetical protein